MTPRIQSSERCWTVVDFLNAQNSRAAENAAAVLKVTPEKWRDADRLSFGQLQGLLDLAHADCDCNPTEALAITHLVLRHAYRARVPETGKALRRSLVGRAWKEHGNALFALGHLREALDAARHAVRILAKRDTLLIERTTASLLEAVILLEQERNDEADLLLRESEKVFQRHGDARRLLQVVQTRGMLLYRMGAFEEARIAFLTAQASAEKLPGRPDLPRILNNLGQCAVSVRDFAVAVVYLRNALEAFDIAGMTTERQRVFWGVAKILKQKGNTDEARAEYGRIRREFLVHGMVVEAALVGVELLALFHEAGEMDQVELLAQELVVVFSNAGMQRQLQRALGYIADQARLRAKEPLGIALRYVDSFIQRLSREPDAFFETPQLQSRASL